MKISERQLWWENHRQWQWGRDFINDSTDSFISQKRSEDQGGASLVQSHSKSVVTAWRLQVSCLSAQLSSVTQRSRSLCVVHWMKEPNWLWRRDWDLGKCRYHSKNWFSSARGRERCLHAYCCRVPILQIMLRGTYYSTKLMFPLSSKTKTKHLKLPKQKCQINKLVSCSPAWSLLFWTRLYLNIF